MKREIKFRAWDTHDKAMLYNEFMHVSCMASLHGALNCRSDIVVMQFTGWHDKNDKEIYEGDIVRCFAALSGEVVWDDVTDGWRIVIGSTYNLRNNDMVVIGNIYENATLSGADGGVE